MNDYFKIRDQGSLLPHLLRNLLGTIIFAGVVALSFILIENKPLLDNLVLAICIGLPVCLFVMLGIHGLRPNNRIAVLIIMIIGNILGICVGIPLGFTVIGADLSIFMKNGYILRISFVSFLIALSITYFFFSRKIIAAKEALIQEERIKNDLKRPSSDCKSELPPPLHRLLGLKKLLDRF